MTREPSIHITQTKLKEILKEAEVEGNLDDLVKFILVRASEHKLNTRKVLVNTKKLTEKITKTLRVSSDITSEMNKAIIMVRKNHKHKNITTIRPGTKDYAALKTVASNAEVFYKTFFDKTESRFEAYKIYIETYMSFSKNFILNFFANSHDRICELYNAKIKIANDPNSNLTAELLKLYNRSVIEQTGTLLIDHSKTPNQYLYFVRTAEICKDLNIPTDVYIKAQFDRFSFFNSIPEPKDLVTEKALLAIQRFITKNPQYSKKTEISKEKINRLKNIGKKW